jgi:hypothetical protein
MWTISKKKFKSCYTFTCSLSSLDVTIGATEQEVKQLCPLLLSFLCKKSAPKLSKCPNWEQVAVVAVIEVERAIEASNMFLHYSERKQTICDLVS